MVEVRMGDTVGWVTATLAHCNNSQRLRLRRVTSRDETYVVIASCPYEQDGTALNGVGRICILAVANSIGSNLTILSTSIMEISRAGA
jgi:hypothetical protein